MTRLTCGFLFAFVPALTTFAAEPPSHPARSRMPAPQYRPGPPLVVMPEPPRSASTLDSLLGVGRDLGDYLKKLAGMEGVGGDAGPSEEELRQAEAMKRRILAEKHRKAVIRYRNGLAVQAMTQHINQGVAATQAKGDAHRRDVWRHFGNRMQSRLP